MNEDAAKRRLGRGLAALIGEIDSPDPVETISGDDLVPISRITANPANPRRVFLETELGDLADSIREHGIVQPVVVRPAVESDSYEIIAGERRWRAAKQAGLGEIPIIVRDVDDRTALELAIVENVQRADLNAVEEAKGYQNLIDNHNYTQAELAKVIGKSRSHVANTLRLLKLPDSVQALLTDGSLSAGHARALVTARDPAYLAKKIVEGGLSVRQAEVLAQDSGAGTSRAAPKPAQGTEKDADTKALEKALSDATGLAVRISHRGNAGDIKISYKTLEQLDDICRRLKA